MSDTSITSDEAVVDGKDLKQRLAQAERRNKIRAFSLVLPLLIFISFTFLAPIGYIMGKSFFNDRVSSLLPETIIALKDWTPSSADDTPPVSAFNALARDITAARKAQDLGKLATRLNYDRSGMRSLVMKSGRKASKLLKKDQPPADWKQALIKIDKRWGKRDYWTAIKNTSSPWTLAFYLKAIDYRYDWNKDIVPVKESVQLYWLNGWDSVWVRTMWISFLVTFFCVLLGYPVAYLLANLPMRLSNLLMILVLLPFWTSLLVRTTSWIVVLQSEGVLNDILIFMGIIDERIQLIFNRFGVIVAMTHILLPFMILPIYSVMKNISPTYMRAARSMGAHPAYAFWRVYFPQSLPGIGAGTLLVFILALGYYITPALVGGPKDQLVSYFIADHTNRSLNWSLASALGGILLVWVLGCYVLYDKVVGIDNMKMG